MPIVSVGRDKLFEALGKTYTDDEFQALCFEYGIELDDVTSEQEMHKKELGSKGASKEDIKCLSEEILYKIDIPANRYDMLCLEGIARALNIFNRRIPRVDYRLANMAGKEMQRLVVKPETALVRPFVVAAILRGVKFDAQRYNSFIDLQDKLHQNLCRQRSLVAIGTHDLGTVQGPFTYEALSPADIVFRPLKQTREFNAAELLQHYVENDLKLRKFVPIIQQSVVYPVILDANRTVLSLPPIINGAHSAISLDTRDVFIECTATDLTKAKTVLNTMCTMFSEYCSTPFEVEPVEVIDAFGQSHVFPDLASRVMEVEVAYINRCVGVDLGAAAIAELLSRMALTAKAVRDGQAVSVEVPPTRSDVLHACDVMEDVAIAYGYNNIEWTVPSTTAIGAELPLSALLELLRAECAMAGFTEILTWALCSRAENFTQLLRPDDGASAASIGNPATSEFEVCRTSLLPGALKTLGANKDAPLPVKLFEASDVILLDTSAETGARNERRLVAVACAKEGSFEVIHGLLNRVMDVLGVPLLGELGTGRSALQEQAGVGYEWQPSEDPTFFPGRQASVSACGKTVGHFGVVHPEVLAAFDIPYPVSALELNVESFVFDQFYKPLPTHMQKPDAPSSK
ncbi:Phenylalanine-tRNA ligase beta subunit [Coccomyxa sp. Obi]|nr:Phenylalanine-tRNA ligase beta subunit [Coccomyxa sp. Obi]